MFVKHSPTNDAGSSTFHHKIEALRERLSSRPEWRFGWSSGLTLHQQEQDVLKLILGTEQRGTLHALQTVVSEEDTPSSLGISLLELQELHLSAHRQLHHAWLPQDQSVLLHRLKRLYLYVSRVGEAMMWDMLDRMVNLESLSLWVSDHAIFHKNCPGPIDMAHDRLVLSHLTKLRHLDLHGICIHHPIEDFALPQLHSLRIVLPELYSRVRRLDYIRPAADIRYIATKLPHLTRLELHVGQLWNLWHPTAIPGVDVDNSVYQFLTTIASIPHLSILRLFPHYIPRDACHNYLNARQALSDEQAVRIFQYLRRLRPTLQILSVAATFGSLRGFSPMTWTVRDGGNHKTILTTRQEGKDYELQQIWLGERRMTTRTKRHSYRKPYLEEYGDWTFAPRRSTPA